VQRGFIFGSFSASSICAKSIAVRRTHNSSCDQAGPRRCSTTLFEELVKIVDKFWYKARHLFHFSLVNSAVEQY
jgi:hypothetical protein